VHYKTPGSARQSVLEACSAGSMPCQSAPGQQTVAQNDTEPQTTSSCIPQLRMWQLYTRLHCIRSAAALWSGQQACD
jgi:hypothetical protein